MFLVQTEEQNNYQRITVNTPRATHPGRLTGARKSTPLFLKVGEGFGERAKTFFPAKKSFRPFPVSFPLKPLLFACEVAVAEGVVHFKVGCEFGFDISVEEQCGVHSFSRGGVVDDF